MTSATPIPNVTLPAMSISFLVRRPRLNFDDLLPMGRLYLCTISSKLRYVALRGVDRRISGDVRQRESVTTSAIPGFST